MTVRKMVEELQDYANAQYVQSDKDFFMEAATKLDVYFHHNGLGMPGTKIFDDLLEDMNDYYDMQEEYLMLFTDADDNATRSAYICIGMQKMMQFV